MSHLVSEALNPPPSQGDKEDLQITIEARPALDTAGGRAQKASGSRGSFWALLGFPSFKGALKGPKTLHP